MIILVKLHVVGYKANVKDVGRPLELGAVDFSVNVRGGADVRELDDGVVIPACRVPYVSDRFDWHEQEMT